METPIIPENIHLIAIQRLKEYTTNDMKEIAHELEFQIQFNMLHNLEKEIVNIRLYLLLNEINKQNKIKEVGNYEIDFIFKVNGLSEHYQLNNEVPMFAGNFVGTLLAISYSTLRGMLFDILKKTKFENTILPVISIQKLMEQRKSPIGY